MTTREEESRKIFEALGRYVVAFENLVHEVRELCLLLMVPEPDLDVPAQELALIYAQAQARAEVPLHSKGMTADPLREVFLAHVGERMKQIEADAATKGDPFPQEDSAAIRGVAQQIGRDFQHRTQRRNEIVHAKWFIGFGDKTPAGLKDTGYYKRRLSLAGLGFVKDPPNTADDIDARIKECEGLAAFAMHFASGFIVTDGPRGMSKLFEQRDKRWEIKTSAT